MMTKRVSVNTFNVLSTLVWYWEMKYSFQQLSERVHAGADTGFARGGGIASAELEPIPGVWGRSSLAAESFLSLYIQKVDQKIRI